MAAFGWRAPDEARLGTWLLRAASGFTGRANSALAIGDPGLPLATAVGRVCRWYQARGLPAMVAIPFPLRQPHRCTIDRFLGSQGWPIRPGVATVMTARPGMVVSPALTAHVGVDPEPDEGWLRRYHYRGHAPPPIARQLLMSAPWQAFASIREAGETIGIGRVAVAGHWAGLTAVEVAPGHRRRGLATAITSALAAVAAARGATGLFLQVDDENTAARTLYGRIGFVDHHGYHYRIVPAAPRPD